MWPAGLPGYLIGPGGADVPAERQTRGRGDSGGARLGAGRLIVFRSALVTAVLAVAATVLGIALVPGTGTASRLPVSRGAGLSSAIGALFTTQSGRLASHFCSATVVDSPAGDLVLTAAHCVTGRATDTVAFVPAYAHGKAPYGIWMVTKVFVDQNWRTSADPDDDFAFLDVKRTGSTARVEDVTGAEAVGIGQPAGEIVTVTGYPSDLDAPISCDNDALAYSATQFQFDCDGYTDGTSGGPFLSHLLSPNGPGIVIGVIGGFEQGGLTPSVSYAARFGQRMAQLYQTAVAAARS
jgi:V8-like Glu-specific endopeptidase